MTMSLYMTLSGHTSTPPLWRPPSSWLPLPVSHELESSQLASITRLWDGTVDIVRVQVWHEEMRQVKVLTLLGLVLGAATPMSDTVSDSLVAASFYMVGDRWWFGFSVADLVFAGCMGMVAVGDDSNLRMNGNMTISGRA